jgi:hypothetical protein
MGSEELSEAYAALRRRLRPSAAVALEPTDIESS